MVTIVISYRAGTSDMLKVCLHNLEKHTQQECVCIVVTSQGDEGLEELQSQHQFTVMEVAIPDKPEARIHGMMLDKVIPSEITTEYVMTLDSDCFPVADGWLQGLLDMDAQLTGILHPWAPPPEDMLKMRMEYRIRSQHCWESTHVACQMMKLTDYKHLKNVGKVNYAGGDDTGLLIPLRAKAQKWKIAGYKPTRCPLPVAKEGASKGKQFEPEYNRFSCVVFGDMVCHVGSYTLGHIGQVKPGAEWFDWAVQRILAERGAEFLLEDRLSHKFAFDREEAIAKFKMNQTFGVSDDGRSLRQS